MIAEHLIRATEKETASSGAHLRLLHRLSGGIFYRLMVAFAALRFRAPNPEARAIAGLAAILRQDCGPCLEISVRFARKDRVDDHLIRAVLSRQPEALPEPLRNVYALAQAVYDHSADVEELSAAIERDFGAATRADVALTLAFTPAFPFLKRALGVITSHCVRPETLLDAA